MRSMITLADKGIHRRFFFSTISLSMPKQNRPRQKKHFFKLQSLLRIRKRLLVFLFFNSAVFQKGITTVISLYFDHFPQPRSNFAMLIQGTRFYHMQFIALFDRKVSSDSQFVSRSMLMVRSLILVH